MPYLLVNGNGGLGVLNGLVGRLGILNGLVGGLGILDGLVGGLGVLDGLEGRGCDLLVLNCSVELGYWGSGNGLSSVLLFYKMAEY
jgi:hypothetical protein